MTMASSRGVEHRLAAMSFVVAPAPACRIVDTDRKVNALAVQALAAAGYAGIARYVPLPNNSAADDIAAAELAAILDGGLGLLLVQHPRYPGWDPARISGAADAAAAVETARAAGYAPGAHIYLDLEGPRAAAPAQTLIAFANAWADAVVAAGYLAGCYVGFGLPLSPQQLYDLHRINTYWSDIGPRDVALRGFAVKQGPATNIAGIAFDEDVVMPDALGETPVWMLKVSAIA